MMGRSPNLSRGASALLKRLPPASEALRDERTSFIYWYNLAPLSSFDARWQNQDQISTPTRASSASPVSMLELLASHLDGLSSHEQTVRVPIPDHILKQDYKN